MKKLLSLLAILLFSVSVKSQNVPNPYASIGKSAPKMVTLSNGAYDEFLLKQPLVLINHDAIDRKTGEMVYSKEENPEMIAKLEKEEEDKFRFLSIDPLSRQFPFYSPYQYAGNKPISSIDADGLEDVDYRLVETYNNGSAFVKVGRSDGSTANSHNGNLQIHNLNDGKSYSSFEWNELNTLFGIDQNSSFVGDKINSSGVAGPSSYSFRLSDPNDIIKGGKTTVNADGTKNVVSFSALVSKARTVTPYDINAGNVSSIAYTPQHARNFILKTAKELINPNQEAFGQTANDVTEINITIGTNEYKNIKTDKFMETLQGAYKNAKINITQGDTDTGYNIEYKGSEAKQAPKPIDE